MAVLTAYLLLAGRLIYLQVIRHAYFSHEVEAYRVSRNVLPAQRGLILDRNGEPLAVNVPACAVYADPAEIQDVAGTAAKLAPLVGIDQARLLRMLTPRNKRTHYVSLLRHADIGIGDRVKAAELMGVCVIGDKRRAYPNRTLAAQVLGFTDRDLNGIEGVERSEDTQLQGVDGLVVGEVDHRGHFVPGTIRTRREPVDGHSVYLTIDRTLQEAADAELTAAVKEHNADHGVVVILDPGTGEILALSNAPGYDPNVPRPAKALDSKAAAAVQALWRNHAVSDLYEPGSTMKTITASAVLQEDGVAAMNRHVHCSGELQIGNHVIHCAKDPPYNGVHGDEDMRGVLRESCNVGMAQFGMALGADKLFRYEQLYGFLDKPQTGMPGEECSHLQSPDTFNRFTGSMGWSKIQLANIAFGQGISLTPVQLAAAYGAIANDGVLMHPHIVKAIGSGGDQVPVTPVAERRVLSSDVAAAVRSMLETVVQKGTGKPAQIAGFSMGGKTGSAQVAGPHGYEAGHYVSSFIGLLPLDKPRLVILCAVFEPKGTHWGATVAAPVVHNLAQIAVREMHLPPDAPDLADWKDHNKVQEMTLASVGGVGTRGGR